MDIQCAINWLRKDRLTIIDSKQKELANYCKKYNKNKNSVVKNYEKTREFVPVIIGG